MNSFLRLLGCILLLGLSSCGGSQHFFFKPPTAAIAQCQISCSKSFETCKKNCTNNCRNCSAQSARSSAKHFSKYVRNQSLQGRGINRELNSYRDPLRCLKTTCNCVADLDVCKQGCTGIVRKDLIATPLPDCI